MNMGWTPHVSVVMPVYNGARYLSDAVQSILSQSFDDFEFIIVDDGSTDKTWQILSKYSLNDKRIVLHRNPANLGIIKALNEGLILARGRYIARQDSDDISLPKRLSTQVIYLDSNPKIGLLGSAYYRSYAQGKVEVWRPPVSETEIRWQLLFRNHWCHSSMMFRRELLKDVEDFYRDFHHAEDYELWIRLLGRTHVAGILDPLVIYRAHNDSICIKHQYQQRQTVLAISAHQINSLFNQSQFNLAEVDTLRRCYNLERLKKQEMATACHVFKIFDAFALQPGIDPKAIQKLRRDWIRNTLTRNFPVRLVPLIGSGLLKLMLFHGPMAVFMAWLIDWPKKVVFHLRRAIQSAN